MLTETQEVSADPRGGGSGTSAKHHPSPAALRRFARGELTPTEAKEIVRHLLHRCASCEAAARKAYPGTKGDQP